MRSSNITTTEQPSAALKAIRLNGEGIEKIGEGDYIAGLLALMDALTTVRTAAREKPSEHQRQQRQRRILLERRKRSSADNGADSNRNQIFFRGQEQEDQQKQDDDVTISSSSSTTTTRRRSIDSTVLEVEAGSADCFVCEQPIDVDASLASSTNPIETFNVLSYCIAYNLALCQHLRGMDIMREPLEARSSYLKRSIQLYKQVLNLMRNVSCSLLETPLHAMVILNNMGQAHRLLQNHPSAHHCFHHLWKAMRKTATSRRERTGTDESDVIMIGLMSNIIRLIAPPSKTLASAA
jgi:hypothetical protein